MENFYKKQLLCATFLTLGMTMVSAQTEQTKVNNDFSLNFFENVINLKGDSNLVVSPLGVDFVLGMLDSGATGQTAEEINKALGVTDAGALASYHQNLMKTLSTSDDSAEFDIANCIILNQNAGFSFLPAYTDNMQTKYDALIRSMDFNAPSTLDYINNWSSENTKGMVPKILKDLSPNLVSLFMNALYFKGIWNDPFDTNWTTMLNFYAADGTKHYVEMMVSANAREYAENDTFQTLKMDYGNGSYSMYILLPQKGRSFSDVLSIMKKTDWMKAPKMNQSLNVFLPKFTTESTIDLKDIMKAMGMPTMFDAAKADFSGMVDIKDINLYVDLFMQKAKILVDENGTEAASTTIAGAMPSGMAQNIFYAARPFLYAIVENASSTICFMGQYTGIGATSAAKDADGILNPVVENHQKALYDLGGRKLNAAPSKGVYIVDGKKVMAH
jgi:serine protease inhibitor